MSHGCTVSRKDRLTAHRNSPCVLPLSSLGKSEAYRTKHWSEGLKWVVTLPFGGEKRKSNTHSGCPLPLAKPALLPHHLPHFCLRVRMIRDFFFFPAPAARQPAATRVCVCVWKKACLFQPLQTRQVCEEPHQQRQQSSKRPTTLRVFGLEAISCGASGSTVHGGRSLWNGPICCRSRPLGRRFLLGLHVVFRFQTRPAAPRCQDNVQRSLKCTLTAPKPQNHPFISETQSTKNDKQAQRGYDAKIGNLLLQRKKKLFSSKI